MQVNMVLHYASLSTLEMYHLSSIFQKESFLKVVINQGFFYYFPIHFARSKYFIRMFLYCYDDCSQST